LLLIKKTKVISKTNLLKGENTTKRKFALETPGKNSTEGDQGESDIRKIIDDLQKTIKNEYRGLFEDNLKIKRRVI